MSLKKISQNEIESLMRHLKSARNNYLTHTEYLEQMQLKKFEFRCYTEEDWKTVEDFEDKMLLIKKVIEEAIESSERILSYFASSSISTKKWFWNK